jgi:hypothetical protein
MSPPVEPSENPFVRFQLKALLLAPRLGFNIESVNEALGILRSVFGEAWLQAALSDMYTAKPFIEHRHPLGAALSVGGVPQVALVLEVAAYLRDLCATSGLTGTVDGLRAQFDSALLQLAFAYRFGKIGGKAIELEPSAAGGRNGDIALSYGGRRYMVECYSSRDRSTSIEECERLARRVLKTLEPRSSAYSVCVALHLMPSPMQRKALGRRISQMADEVDAMAKERPEDFGVVHGSGPEAEVSVMRWVWRRIDGFPERPVAARSEDFSKTADDWDFCARSDLVQASRVLAVQDQAFVGRSGSQVALWLPPEVAAERSLQQDLAAPLARLADRTEHKLAQTRTVSEDPRLMIVNSWVTGQLHRAGAELVERMKTRLVDSHRGIEAVVLVLRGWHEQLGRYGFTIVPLVRRDASAETCEMLAALARLEATPMFGR